MWLPARGRFFCVAVPAVFNGLRPLSDPLALPHKSILKSFVIGLVPSRTSLLLTSCSAFWHLAPRCVFRRGIILLLSLHTVTTRASPPIPLLFTKIYVPTLCTVGLWCLK